MPINRAKGRGRLDILHHPIAVVLAPYAMCCSFRLYHLLRKADNAHPVANFYMNDSLAYEATKLMVKEMIRLTWYSSALAASSIFLASSARAAVDPAVQKIEAYDEGVIGVMKQGRALGVAGRQKKFLGIVAQYYDVPAMSALVAGSAWATTTAADKTALIAAFSRYSAYTLATNFASYDGETFVVDPKVQRRGNDAIVSVRITSAGSTTPLIYRTRNGRIVDIYAKGVSQISLQRSDFAGTIRTAGIKGLAKKLSDLTARDSSAK